MEIFTDGNLLARILLTLVTVGYALVTVLADINKTHATNPAWTPHARFHVVWQVASYAGFGVLALVLIWAPGPHASARLYLAAAFAVIIYVAFFLALFTMRLYGGSTFDSNGYPPLPVRLGQRHRLMDLNVTVFSGFTVTLLATVLVLSRAALAG
jgi:hypothetical protein